MEETLKTLGNLKPNKGSHRERKRIGRGIGSGTGKTSGKGHKGQTARKGGSIRPGFEGGQTPLYRRLPKRGFTPVTRNRFNIVNLDQINNIKDVDVIDRSVMEKAGLIRRTAWPVKLLGRGKLERKVTITVDKASESASKTVASAGGEVKLTSKK